ncbi:MAG: AGE family epimerase/isomerase [Spirochaetales bacterium]|nr:AGE family epimerase/isomerase [Spirochaetales bacterium]
MNWQKLKIRVREELHGSILNYWMEHMRRGDGGLYGEISNDNIPDPDAPTGLVMVSRFLWTYSEAYRMTERPEYLEFATELYDILISVLTDPEYGGFYWLVDRDGKPVDDKKVLYGQAFALYGLSTFQMISPSAGTEKLCREIFGYLERYGRDRELGGYYEACSRDWAYGGVNNLGADDMACEKSMNTNLHMLEAYTRYYLQSRREDVKEALVSLIRIITDKIYDRSTGHQKLYFSKDWTPAGDVESYGHDVETSWLLWEALQILGDENLQVEYRETVLRLLDVSSVKATAPDGSLYNEKHDGHLDKTRIWWVQAEYAVSLMNGWEMTGNEEYLIKLEKLWNYIETQQTDRVKGEWFWGIKDDGSVLDREKGGMWKTPYHNGRASMELIHRIEKQEKRNV